jgi:GNAT superfamily N-acetyltransferase
MAIDVRALCESDLDEADRIFRLAFGTFLGLPDPLAFGGDTDYVRTRWRATPEGAFAAVENGALLGSNLTTRWGSFGFFGPISVRPDLWDRGVARRLLEPTMGLFERWQTTHRGLFTFSHSGKHHALYQKFGFYPRFLTSVLAKSVAAPGEAPTGMTLLSECAKPARESLLGGCRAVAESIYAGLDLTDEIGATAAGGLGDTVILAGGDRVEGFGVCHVGKGSEAGSGNAYVKFGAVPRGDGAPRVFARLLDACEAFAKSRGAITLVAGANLAREGAYRELLRRGFRAIIVGVAMQSGNEPGYNVPGVWVIDDWR